MKNNTFSIKYFYDSLKGVDPNLAPAKSSFVNIHIIRFARPKIHKNAVKIRIQKFNCVAKNGKIKKHNNGKLVKFCAEGNVIKDCSNLSYLEYREDIYPAVAAMLKDASKIYTVAQCKKILQNLPSSFLRTKETYEAYASLIDSVVNRELEGMTKKNKLNPDKYNKCHNAKRVKYLNKYLVIRHKALKEYLTGYSKIEELENKAPLTKFEKEKFVDDVAII